MIVTRVHGYRDGYQTRLQSIRYGGDELKIVKKTGNIGGKSGDADDKTGDIGGVMFDSGTSFTYLVPEAYNAVLSAVSR